MTDINHNETERSKRIQAMRQRTGQMEREGSYWTADDKDNLKTLFFQNVGITDIALILQRTEVAVAQQIQMMNLYEKVRRPSGSRRQEGCLCRKCGLQGSADCRGCFPEQAVL